MIYYMVFQISDEDGQLVHEPCFDGCRVFMTKSKEIAFTFLNEIANTFQECSYKVVPVEV